MARAAAVFVCIGLFGLAVILTVFESCKDSLRTLVRRIGSQAGRSESAKGGVIGSSPLDYC